MCTKDDEVQAFEGDGRGVTKVREDMKGATLVFCSVRKLLTILSKWAQHSGVEGSSWKIWVEGEGRGFWKIRVGIYVVLSEMFTPCKVICIY